MSQQFFSAVFWIDISWMLDDLKETPPLVTVCSRPSMDVKKGIHLYLVCYPSLCIRFQHHTIMQPFDRKFEWWWICSGVLKYLKNSLEGWENTGCQNGSGCIDNRLHSFDRYASRLLMLGMQPNAQRALQYVLCGYTCKSYLYSFKGQTNILANLPPAVIWVCALALMTTVCRFEVRGAETWAAPPPGCERRGDVLNLSESWQVQDLFLRLVSHDSFFFFPLQCSC